MVCFEQFRECSSWWVKGSKFSVQRLVGERGYEWLLCSAVFMVSDSHLESADDIHLNVQVIIITDILHPISFIPDLSSTAIGNTLDCGNIYTL